MPEAKNFDGDMIVPKAGSRRHELWQVFVQNGGMTLDTLISRFGMFGCKREWQIGQELQTLTRYRCLKLIGNVYFPTTEADNAPEKVDLVPSREPWPFKPFVNFYPKVSPRGQPIEKRHFISCTNENNFR